MKTSFLHIILLLHFHLVYPQDTTTKSTYTLGNHGIEVTLDAPWNFVKQTEDWYEILYGCSGNEHCANIQVSFWHEDIGGTIEENIDNIIKEYKKKFPDLIFNKSDKDINDLQFHIIDLYLINNGFFLGQTVALAKSKFEIIDFTYTANKLRVLSDRKIKKYITERNRLLDVLSTINLVESKPVANNKSDSGIILINCNDTTSLLVTQKDSLKCYVSLTGNVFQRSDSKAVMLDGIILIPFFADKEPFIPKDSIQNSDKAILLNFLDMYSSVSYGKYYPKKGSNYYFNIIPLDSTEEGKVLIWYVCKLTKKEFKKKKEMDKEGIHIQPLPINRIIFVSLIVNDSIYNLAVVYRDDQSFNEIKNLISEIIKSLGYTYDTLELYDVCPQYLLNM